MHTRTAQRLLTAHRKHASNKYLQDLEAEITFAFAILLTPPPFQSAINIQINTKPRIITEQKCL